MIHDRRTRDRDFPEDWAYGQENGHYRNTCSNCKQPFDGHKYRRICKKCVETPEEKEPRFFFTVCVAIIVIAIFCAKGVSEALLRR
jgi:predicted amidophosphoribosyltransferase